MNTPLWTQYGLDPNTGNPPMAMDYRHVELLHSEILKARPKVAVEIGSHKGHSLVAFLEAMKELPEMQVHVFEPHPTDSLWQMVTEPHPIKRISVHPRPVWTYGLRPDFVFIDGDHGIPALADLAWCLANHAPVIAMHDTRTAFRLPHCDGAAAAASLLRGMGTREWREDCVDRPGEHTWRGFGVSTIL